MSASRLWLTGFRVVIIAAMVGALTGAAVAQPKFPNGGKYIGTQESDEFPGLIAAGDYISPQFGVQVTWTDQWAVGDSADPIVAHAIGGNFPNSVASDPDLGDIIFLVDSATGTSVLSLGFSPASAAYDTQAALTIVQQQSFLVDSLFLSRDAALLLVDATPEAIAVVARDAAPNDEHIVYWMTYADPGGSGYTFWVGLDLYDSTQYERILRSIDDGISVDGSSLFPVMSVDEILAAIVPDSEPRLLKPTAEPTQEPTVVPPTTEPTQVPTAVPPTTEPTQAPTAVPPTAEPTQVPTAIPPTVEPTALPTEGQEEIIGPSGTPASTPVASPVANDFPGLVSPGNYLSALHNVPVTWTDAWVPDPSMATPFASYPASAVDEVHLADADGRGVQVFISIEAATPAFDAATYLTAITDATYIVDVLKLSPATTVVATSSGNQGVAAVYVDRDGDRAIVRILEVHPIDTDTVAFIDVQVDADEVSIDLLGAIANDININGNPSLQLFTPSMVVEAIAP